ncbi:universal stress protein [Poseidonocella sp. HB161398]|uniref:universal stress protein n=1 Tax=Poseidonocella sp. HB161398 TaxID=2320855 RepID=UPI001108D460|nr:universal stress protein [Poseidonocella sp. HB161398]
MKTILVGSDLSLRSDRARRRALRLARAHGAKLVVCCVIDSDLAEQMSGPLDEEARREIARQCGSDSGVPVEIVIGTGEPVSALATAIRRTAPDLVVLGVHRRHPLRDLLAGTTVERLLRATSCPVLLVAGAAEAEYSRVLCGIDMSGACAAAARWAARIAPEAAFSSVHAVHIPFRSWLLPSEAPAAVAPFLEEAAARLAEWREAEVVPRQLPQPEPRTVSLPEALRDACREVRPDLLAIGAHARRGPGRIGSVTRRLVRRPPCDLLILRG